MSNEMVPGLCWFGSTGAKSMYFTVTDASPSATVTAGLLVPAR